MLEHALKCKYESMLPSIGEHHVPSEHQFLATIFYFIFKLSQFVKILTKYLGYFKMLTFFLNLFLPNFGLIFTNERKRRSNYVRACQTKNSILRRVQGNFYYYFLSKIPVLSYTCKYISPNEVLGDISFV